MALTSFDGPDIMISEQNLMNQDLNQKRRKLQQQRRKFKLFIRDWTRGNFFIYREQLLNQAKRFQPLLQIDLQDIQSFDAFLCAQIQNNPSQMLVQFDKGAAQLWRELQPEGSEAPAFQVSLISSQKSHMLRDLQSDLIDKLVVIPAIVISTSKPTIKGTLVRAQCKGCNSILTVEVEPGLTGMSLPRVCSLQRPIQGTNTQKCPLDPFFILSDRSEFINQQQIKLQERPEDVPTGEMPRTVVATLQKLLVDKIAPGSRVTVLAVYSVYGNKSFGLRNSYLRVVGIMIDDSQQSRYRNFYTIDEQEIFYNMSRQPDIYNRISNSIAPAVYGNDDIKKSIACLLFGGTRKLLQQGVSLRGDINVLLLGDPSTAKSQLLKFVGRAAPIAVTTSGKGSSASGLTASVIRDSGNKEFQLEGGAMVLADGGVVCIDEFDKMRPQDRVAIHQAMEQQTISVAKAGITTILNSRTSVLAAANPIHGTYDDFKQAQEQIDLQTTILSRFDCIFLVRDLRNEDHDSMIAKHVVDLHMGNIRPLEQRADIEIDLLKKYVAYAKAKCSPKITHQSAQRLQDFYVADRKKQDNGAFPITVRQLEAIIRLSEAIAKMSLSSMVSVAHVEEAHRLFEVSTLSAASAGLSSAGISIPRELADLVQRIQESIRRRVAIGTKIAKAHLQRELLTLFSDSRAVDLAVINMIKREELVQFSGWRMLKRLK